MGIFAVHAIWLGNGNASQGGLLILPYAYRAAWCMRAHLVGWGGPLGRTGKRLGDQSVGYCEKEHYPKSIQTVHVGAKKARIDQKNGVQM